jgi:hypothetical protein
LVVDKSSLRESKSGSRFVDILDEITETISLCLGDETGSIIPKNSLSSFGNMSSNAEKKCANKSCEPTHEIKSAAPLKLNKNHE